MSHSNDPMIPLHPVKTAEKLLKSIATVALVTGAVAAGLNAAHEHCVGKNKSEK